MPASPIANGNGILAKATSTVVPIITVVAIFFAGMWTVAFGPMFDNVKELQRSTVADRVWTQKQDVQIKHLEEAIERIDRRHESHVVPRSENDIRLSQIVKQQELLGERLNELRKATLTSVTVGDDLKRLNSEIADLRRQLQEKTRL